MQASLRFWTTTGRPSLLADQNHLKSFLHPVHRFRCGFILFLENVGVPCSTIQSIQSTPACRTCDISNCQVRDTLLLDLTIRCPKVERLCRDQESGLHYDLVGEQVPKVKAWKSLKSWYVWRCCTRSWGLILIALTANWKGTCVELLYRSNSIS